MRSKNETLNTLPVLYSLQNCPYAMRARLAILLAQQTVQVRAITMKDKPADMLLASPKGTVPVLIIDNGVVVDESLEIMLWALNSNDPDNLLYSHDKNALKEMLEIIEENDATFKPRLEKYKRAKRFHGEDEEACRLACEPFIQALEERLTQHDFFMGAKPSLLDYALLPFIRQYSRVNKPIFAQEQYTNLRHWLSQHLQSQLFSRAMFKYPLWLDEHEVCFFGDV